MIIPVKLTPEELLLAGVVGLKRFARTIEMKLTERSQIDERFRMHRQVLGAWGEYAVAQYLGLSWPLSSGIGRGDVGLGANYEKGKRGFGKPIEVRTTSTEGVMYLHDEDDNASAYVGVFYRPRSTFEILGWCWGHEGKHEYYLKPAHAKCPRPYYEVPVSILHAIDAIRDEFPSLYPSLVSWEHLSVIPPGGRGEHHD